MKPPTTESPQSSLLRRSRSTMPQSISASAAPEPGRSAAGPPTDGVERMTQTMQEAEAQGLHLLRDVPEGQLAEDRAQAFDGADRYVRRVAEAMATALALLVGFSWKPEDLLKRLQRVEALDKLIETTEALLGLLKDTRAVELADLLRMCDLVVAELEALSARPLLDEGTRGKLLQILRGPLSVWEKRIERIRKTKDLLAGLRSEIAEAQAAAERAPTAQGTPPLPSPAASLAASPPPPAPRSGRRTPR